MDIRPIGFAAWVAAVVAVAACSPRDDTGLDVNPSTTPSASARAGAGKAPARAADAPATPEVRAQHSDPTAAMGAPPASGASAVKDAHITQQVKAELAAARDLSGARIDVDTRDGVVTLSGPVRTAAVKARAAEIARTVQDVRDVNDQLTLVVI